MKSIIVLCLSVASVFSYSQPIDPATGKIMFTDIIEVDSVSKDELFNRASTWFAKKFNSSKEVIQRSDKVDGVIIGKALFMVYMTGLMGENIDSGDPVNYTVSVYTKDGKYKYEITDFIFHNQYRTIELGSASSPKDGYTKKYWIRAKERCVEEANSLMVSLKAAMTTPSDW